MVEKSKTQIHLDKHWLCPEYPGWFGPLPGLIISTYLSGRTTHPSSPILQTFNAPHPEGYIKKELTNGHIQHQSEPWRCRPALPTRRSCLQLAERVRKLLLIFHRRRLDFVIRFWSQSLWTKTTMFSTHTVKAALLYFQAPEAKMWLLNQVSFQNQNSTNAKLW